MFARRMLVAGFVAGLCLMGGCGKGPHPEHAPDAAAIARAQTETSQPAWLHAHLPDHTIAYLRLPSPWTLVGATPTGGPLDRAAVGKRQLEIVDQLRKAAAQQPQLAGGMLGPVIELLFAHLDSPLEAILVDPTGMPTPNAHALLVARLDTADAQRVRQLFDSLPKPSLHMTGPFDAQGNGALAMGARMHFDPSTKRLFVLAGLQPATQEQMDAVLGSLRKSPTTPSSMARLEPGIDASGQGLFAWVKLKGLSSVAASKLPAGLAGALPGNLLEQADAMALGAGSVDGHGRIRVAFSAPGARLLGYLAPDLDFGGLQASGTPRWAFTLALPSAARVAQFEQNLNMDLGASGAQVYRRAMARLEAKGVPPLLTLARVLGPELIMFGDARGTYTALRLRDPGAFHKELGTLAARYHWTLGTARSGTASVHWISAPSWASDSFATDMGKAKDPDTHAVLQLLTRQRTHLYWTEEGHWLVFAKVPQALADRAAAGKHTAMSAWLRAQHYPASTWVGATAVSHGAQREAYYAYLEMLQTLGDLLDSPVDLMKLPSASTLGLPDEGMVGGGLVVTPDRAAFDLDYEQLPTELLHGQGAFATVGAAAILAAIAIPQYQDYITKSQFAESQIIADGLKTPIDAYQQRTGRCPANGAGGIAAPASYTGRYVASATAAGRGQQCTITVRFKEHGKVASPLADKIVTFTGTPVERDYMKWTCSAPDIADKYLPTACRAK